MDRPDYPQDEQPGTTNDVPALIHDYRAQREAWREQARNLARMREEVLTAADHEARGIVSAARADVRRILLKARRDLLVLAAQVRAAGRLGETDDAPDTVAFLPADDLGQVQEAVTTARHDVRRVLDESRPELEGLAAEGEALRSALRPQRPIPPAPGDVRRQIPGSESVTRVERALVLDARDDRLSNAPVDFEFSSIAGDDETDLTVRQERRPIRAFIVAAATIGGIAVMGTGWWLLRPQTSARGSTAVESTKATESTAPPAATKLAANAVGERPIPDPRSPLSIQLAVRRSAWVRVTADGRVTAERIFKQGETQHIRAAREISIRAGDGGAVTVAVDGRQPVTLGREGEVVTRRFAVESPRPQRPAVAAPTASPTVAVAPPAPQQPPPTRAASLGTAGSSAASPPRVTEPLPVSSPPLSPAVPPPTASSPARSAATSVDRSGPPVTPPSANQVSLQDSLIRETSRWLDAYYRQDRATMAAISAQVNVADDRSEKERMPRGLTGVQRSLDDVKVQVAGSGATLTARMTERMENAAAGQMTETVSLVSHMWIQRNGAWQLYDVRLFSASALSRALRSP